MLPSAMYIKYQPADNHRAIANSDSVLLAHILFDEKKNTLPNVKKLRRSEI